LIKELLLSLLDFQSFDAVSVMFCELVGFNSSTVEDAMELVSTMNAVFSCFDALMDTFNVYKVSLSARKTFFMRKNCLGGDRRSNLHGCVRRS